MSGSSPEPRGVEPAARRWVDDNLLLICGLAVGAGLIHVVAAVQHLSEYGLYAAFFAVLAPAQASWAVLVYRSAARRRLLVAGALASVMIAGLWVVTRTTGLPIGPERWQPEAIGPLDLIATADEIALATLVVMRLAPRTNRKDRAVAQAAGAVLILATCLVLVPGHAH